MKKKRKLTIKNTKIRRKYEVEDILELIGIINYTKIKKNKRFPKKIANDKKIKKKKINITTWKYLQKKRLIKKMRLRKKLIY